MNKKEDNSLIIVVLIIIIGLIGYIVYDNMSDNKHSDTTEYESGEYVINPKTYGVNEYSKLTISDEQMSKIYFNDYKNYVRFDMNKAFELVDEDYKDNKNLDYNLFKAMINTRNLLKAEVAKYSIVEKNEYKYYIVVDSFGNKLVFKTNGVMQYTVYLDNETVVIE